jgi:hypothetical protein
MAAKILGNTVLLENVNNAKTQFFTTVFGIGSGISIYEWRREMFLNSYNAQITPLMIYVMCQLD